MTDDADRHIPDEIADAFDRAAQALKGWDRGGAEPSVPFDGQPCTISAVFNLAASFNDPLPIRTLLFLLDYAQQSVGRQAQEAELGKDRSYAIGARCLLQWVQDNKSRFGQ
jgi:hypothetical protein